ncbi:hypothetical protein FPZ24_08035 [Sphingomonas panacisoli]|uniref:Uncharacterized protein n=1 Tax=Sphingomonas panacisoli TaxID=1813879 RepID=A0A5B8LIK5_9SPHN|nr:hypothetical protein [Sphingomonas panacisoli]QDZ07432.1 hypothetical protein FPZ24_08035 [Sphingomonas panacisoli]
MIEPNELVERLPDYITSAKRALAEFNANRLCAHEFEGIIAGAEAWLAVVANPNPPQGRGILRDALLGIEIYAQDTLSGEANPADSRERWYADGIREIRTRARDALKAALTSPAMSPTNGLRELLAAALWADGQIRLASCAFTELPAERTDFRLRADKILAHPALAALESASTAISGEGVPAGMKSWAGGESAPEDWDYGPVRFRSGIVGLGIGADRLNWRIPQRDGADYMGSDIVAYTPIRALSHSVTGVVDNGREAAIKEAIDWLQEIVNNTGFETHVAFMAAECRVARLRAAAIRDSIDTGEGGVNE